MSFDDGHQDQEVGAVCRGERAVRFGLLSVVLTTITMTAAMCVSTAGPAAAADAARPRAAGDPIAVLGVATTVLEGTGGTKMLTATVTLSSPAPAGGATMTLATADGTASSVASADFGAQSIGLTFLAGASGPATINIPITTDGVDEPDETFSISLTPMTGVSRVAGAPATITIVDDDEPLVATLAVPATIVEGTGGTKFLTATVTLSRPAPSTNATMTIATADGTASSVGQADFQAQSIALTFLAGATGPATINVPITTDSLIEHHETFTISLIPTSGISAVVGSPAVVTIIDDDDTTKPSVTINQGAGQADPATSAVAVFDVAFSEDVVGFTGSDVAIGGTAAATSATVIGGPRLYTVTVSGMTVDGTVTATIAAGVASDEHGNTNTASTSTDNTITVLVPPVPATPPVVDDAYHPVTPERLLDTRVGVGAPVGTLVAGGTLVLRVAGVGVSNVPGGASAVVLNVTVTEAVGAGFLTVYPCDQPRPNASNLNYSVGQTVPNLTITKLAVDGTVCLFAQSTVHLIADLDGWYA